MAAYPEWLKLSISDPLSSTTMSGSFDSQDFARHSGEGHSSVGTQENIPTKQIDLNQIYTLIDGILPFEACLYYQILPLFIESSRLVIGIVNPDDKAASDYVKKQLSYINYSLTFRTIPSDWHRDLLSKYLSHNAKARQRPQRQSSTSSKSRSKPKAKAKSRPKPVNDIDMQATFIVDQPDEITDFIPNPLAAAKQSDQAAEQSDQAAEQSDQEVEQSDQAGSIKPDTLEKTFIDDPSAIGDDAVSDNSATIAVKPIAVPVQDAATTTVSEPAGPSSIIAQPADLNAETSVAPVTESKPVLGSDEATATTEPSKEPSTELSNDLSTDDSSPLHLHIEPQYRNSVQDLAQLSPKGMMQVLLSRALDEGIGRLYFEKRPKSGRILWSRDGVLQAILESVDAPILQGVINEFKLLMHLSLITVKKPKQVEIERSFEGERILMRFRVMPNAYGEDATLQVLRGAALRFYQQQQIDKIGRDALDAAQTLKLRLNEIRDRSRQALNSKATRSETLPAIIELLRQMETQIHTIVSEHDAGLDNQSESNQ